MKRGVVAACAVLVLAGCRSGGSVQTLPRHPLRTDGSVTTRRASPPPATRTHKVVPPRPKPASCQLHTSRDVIIYVKVSYEPAWAEIIGDVDYTHCRHTYSTAFLQSFAPRTGGYCAVAAFKTANPGYRTFRIPAPFPQHWVNEAGFCI